MVVCGSGGVLWWWCVAVEVCGGGVWQWRCVMHGGVWLAVEVVLDSGGVWWGCLAVEVVLDSGGVWWGHLAVEHLAVGVFGSSGMWLWCVAVEVCGGGVATLYLFHMTLRMFTGETTAMHVVQLSQASSNHVIERWDSSVYCHSQSFSTVRSQCHMLN